MTTFLLPIVEVKEAILIYSIFNLTLKKWNKWNMYNNLYL